MLRCSLSYVNQQSYESGMQRVIVIFQVTQKKSSFQGSKKLSGIENYDVSQENTLDLQSYIRFGTNHKGDKHKHRNMKQR